MAIISTADELVDSDVYIDLERSVGLPLHLKCEGFNFAGSVKLRAATSMVASGIRSGLIDGSTTLVESSSGNLGVALSVVAAARSIRFVCVTDPKCNPATVKLMRALGSEVVVVDEPDESGSYLSARKALVREFCERDAGFVWLNQYENPANWLAHYENTAPLIGKQFPDLDVLFVGAGTGAPCRAAPTTSGRTARRCASSRWTPSARSTSACPGPPAPARSRRQRAHAVRGPGTGARHRHGAGAGRGAHVGAWRGTGSSWAAPPEPS